MITNKKLKKSLEEIKNITSFDAILYSAKGKHLTGTVEEPEHSDIFVKEFIVSEEDVREKIYFSWLLLFNSAKCRIIRAPIQTNHLRNFTYFLLFYAKNHHIRPKSDKMRPSSAVFRHRLLLKEIFVM